MIPTASRSRESFIILLVLFFLMVIILLPMHKSIFLIQQSSCKGTSPFLPLNGMTTLQSYLSLFN